MARTDKLRQSQLELQAGESGERARQRSHEHRVDTGERQADRAARTRQSDLDRWSRDWENRRRDRAARDKDRAANQAKKRRTSNFGTEGRDPKGKPDTSKADEQKRQFEATLAEKQRQFDTSTQLSAAKSGLQQNVVASKDPRGNPGPDNRRLSALQTEMDQRGKKQMGMSVEQTGRRGFTATPEAEKAAGEKAGMAERALRTKEINAAANFQRAVTSANSAQAAIRGAKTKEAKVEAQRKLKIAENNLIQPLKSDAGRLDRMMKGDATELDWQTVRAMLKNVPPVGMARAIHDEVNEGQIGPATVRWLGEKVAASAIKYIYGTGKIPDGDMVDMASAGMQQFSRKVVEARQLLMPNTVAGQFLNEEKIGQIKRGWADHTEMIHKLGALFVMKQTGTMPMAATSGEQGPTHEQRRADPSRPHTPAEEAGQITPAEAAKRAEEGGGTAAPTTGKQRYEYPGTTGPEGGVEPDPMGFV